MPEQGGGRILADGLDEHPAVCFWRSLDPHAPTPAAIEVLKEGRARRRPETQKASVYRLEGVGQGGSTLIAKRCHRAQAELERRVYGEVLAGLSMPLLTYYGFVEESDGRFGWLFLEDAGDQPFSPHVPEHRVAVAEWLAALHTSTAGLCLKAALPDRGPQRYLGELQATIDSVRRLLDERPARDAGTALLESVLSHCQAVEAHWDQVEAACDSVPRTLVHRDLVTKNIRIRSDAHGLTALPFDWEHAGWGTPISDLAQSPPHSMRFAANPDVPTWCARVRTCWPGIDARADERFALFGTLFRLLSALAWAVDTVSAASPVEAMAELALYEQGVGNVLCGLGIDS